MLICCFLLWPALQCLDIHQRPGQGIQLGCHSGACSPTTAGHCPSQHPRAIVVLSLPRSGRLEPHLQSAGPRVLADVAVAARCYPYPLAAVAKSRCSLEVRRRRRVKRNSEPILPTSSRALTPPRLRPSTHSPRSLGRSRRRRNSPYSAA